MPPSLTDQDIKDDTEIDLESVASVDDTDSTTHDLPTNAAGDVPKGLVLLLHRVRKSQDEHASGLAFSQEKDGKMERILFAQSQGWVAKSSRPEIIFKQGNSSGPQVGSVNFHHWIFDQSRAVVVEDAKGHQTNLKRTGVGSKHVFERSNGQKLYWRRAHGSGENRSKMKRHLECVDDDENVYAFYDRGGAWCLGSQKEVGRFEVKKEGLDAEFVHTLLITLAAMYVKMQKRMVQGSQAGWAGGLPTAVLYTVGG